MDEREAGGERGWRRHFLIGLRSLPKVFVGHRLFCLRAGVGLQGAYVFIWTLKVFFSPLLFRSLCSCPLKKTDSKFWKTLFQLTIEVPDLES